jgi:uncharacterized protein YsxB (DUF464 family)
MIRFRVSKTDDRYSGFICEGHAGWSEEGQDIVCAAVSALTVNTVNSIDALTEDAYEVEQAEDGGYLKLTFTETPSWQGTLLMDSLVLGMKSIEEEYGADYITVSCP